MGSGESKIMCMLLRTNSGDAQSCFMTKALSINVELGILQNKISQDRDIDSIRSFFLKERFQAFIKMISILDIKFSSQIEH